MEDFTDNLKAIFEDFQTIFGLPSSVFRQLRIINHQ